MKLGESGEAFFVEEIPRAEAEACPAYLACSPIPSEGEQLMLAQFGPGGSPPDLSPPDSPPGGKGCDRELFPGKQTAPLSPLHENKEATPQQPRTFRAEAVQGEKAATAAEFRPIQPAASQEEEATTTATGGSKNARRKRRRKSQLKKKSQQQQKKASPTAQDDGDNEGDDAQHSSSATPPPVTPNNGEQQDEQNDDQIQFDMEDVDSELR